MSVDEIAGLIIGEWGTKVLLTFESAGRETRGKSRKFNRSLTRGRGGTYSAASSVMNSPTLSSSSATFQIPDIDRDPLAALSDPHAYRPSSGSSFKALSAFLPDIPRLSLKNLSRNAPSATTSQSARDRYC
jgi:hypothetical protein